MPVQPVFHVWFCGHCGYGPHNPQNDLFCVNVNCSKRRDNYARFESISASTSATVRGSSSQSAAHRGSSSRPSTHNQTSTQNGTMSYGSSQPDYGASGSVLDYGPTTYGPYSWWWCCQCQDGPKNAELQARCIGCQHIPCSYCKRY